MGKKQTSRNVLLAAAGVAGIVLLRDTFTGSGMFGPGQAEASESILLTPPETPPTPSTEAPTATYTLARKLEAQAGRLPSPDLLPLDRELFDPGAIVQAPPGEAQPVTKDGFDPLSEFLATARLQSVMVKDAGGFAVVDGVTVRVGESYNLDLGGSRVALRLVEVSEREAAFEYGGRSARLTIPTGMNAPPR